MSFVHKQAAFIVTGYNYNTIEDFQKAYKDSKACMDLMIGFSQQPTPKIRINGADIPSDLPSPAIVYGHVNKEHQICYNRLLKQLEILSRNYDNNKDLIKNVLYTFAQLKLQEAKAIGLNFIVHYNKGAEKLHLFNEGIHSKLSDFPNNEGFNVYLPVDLIEKFNCKGAYEITKVNTSDANEHVYQITATYGFEFASDSANSSERIKELEAIVNKISLVYEHYNKICNEIVEL
ncbi:MAG: hypothetical protein OSJ27_08655 [Candidatus Gastranaerophilales bacterium]|nr:hypothetical protein [Candidatus Gastranaerophilales bacterium]